MFRFLLYFSGILLSSLGIALFVRADVGVGSGEVFAIGLSLHLPISVGVGYMTLHLLVVLSNSILGKIIPNPFCIIPIFLRGITVDFWLYILDPFHPINLVFRWSLVIIGLLLMGIGLGSYILSNLPRIPVDDFMYTLAKMTKMKVRTARTTFEVTIAFIGFLLGGPVGLGTVVIALGLGPSVLFFVNLFQKWYRGVPKPAKSA
ncbi:YczE/YyaS/YitT family protein [Evansella tamaricis]|uniref:YitT family protein n=1 Tax=Evansella tamaricis TaxID=2069301 RepID=A0ABS6JD13_9BACI|nr:hypothetical protein [Evansella tamaricis]MBU9711556.1 hypothetical protein [Evansella tamaricis]